MNNLPYDIRNIIESYVRHFGPKMKIAIAYEINRMWFCHHMGYEDIADGGLFSGVKVITEGINNNLEMMSNLFKYNCQTPLDTKQLARQIYMNNSLRKSIFFRRLRDQLEMTGLGQQNWVFSNGFMFHLWDYGLGINNGF